MRFWREAVAGESGIALAEAALARQMEAVADRSRGRVVEFPDPRRLAERAARRIGDHLRRPGGERRVGGGPGFDDRAGRRRAVDHAGIECRLGLERGDVEQDREIRNPGSERIADRPHRSCSIGGAKARIAVERERAEIEMIVIADGLIPGNGAVEPGGLERLLVVDRVRAGVRARARRDPLAVEHVDVPAQLDMGGVVARVPEHHAEVERIALVQGVDGLDRGVQHLRGGQHHRRIDRGDAGGGRLALLEGDELVGRLLVGDVNVGEGEEAQQLRLLLRRARRGAGRQEIGARRYGKRRAVGPGAVAELLILVDLIDLRLRQPRQCGGKRDHPLARGDDRLVDGIGRRRSGESGLRKRQPAEPQGAERAARISQELAPPHLTANSRSFGSLVVVRHNARLFSKSPQ